MFFCVDFYFHNALIVGAKIGGKHLVTVRKEIKYIK